MKVKSVVSNQVNIFSIRFVPLELNQTLCNRYSSRQFYRLVNVGWNEFHNRLIFLFILMINRTLRIRMMKIFI